VVDGHLARNTLDKPKNRAISKVAWLRRPLSAGWQQAAGQLRWDRMDPQAEDRLPRRSTAPGQTFLHLDTGSRTPSLTKCAPRRRERRGVCFSGDGVGGRGHQQGIGEPGFCRAHSFWAIVIAGNFGEPAGGPWEFPVVVWPTASITASKRWPAPRAPWKTATSGESILSSSHVSDRRSCSGRVVIVRVMASRTAAAPWPASAGPFFTRPPSSWPGMRGKWSNIVNRVVRSTSVPIAELPNPTMRSPSQ
jgi:hypothetical protein